MSYIGSKTRLGVPRVRILLLVVFDIFAVGFAAFLAVYVRYDFRFAAIQTRYLREIFYLYPFNILVTLVCFYLFKLYQSVWRYASDTELLNVVFAVIVCTAAQIVLYALQIVSLPRSYFPLYGMFLLVMIGGSRFAYRAGRQLLAMRTGHGRKDSVKRCMVIGAGEAGNAIMKEISTSRFVSMQVVCAIDDNKACQGKYLHGVPIIGGREVILEAVEKYEIDEIIIAIPSASAATLRPILEICKESGCQMQILPGIYQLINGEVSVSRLREVQIEDLLGREPIAVDVDEIAEYVRNKTVLVTGGGGSIGSELCRQIAAHQPKRLIIFDIYENSTYEIQQELLHRYPALALTVLIGSVRNTARVEEVFKTYHPDIVYHAAAHKHVPLMEDSPKEAIKNNVFGTWKMAQAADKFGAAKFVLISTDKAVNPTNIMGASKRICEMIVQTYAKNSKTCFVAVRFGNVLGSNGSVIPLFKKQIAQGGPVTVTSPDIIRYFMTIPEAVSLVLQAGAYAKGGEIFVLDMGEPMKIDDLARNLIKLSGLRVDEDIKIEYIGLRPGEKMYEELLLGEEGLKKTANKMIYVAKPITLDEAVFKEQLEQLRLSSLEEESDIRSVVRQMVPTYGPKAE